MTTKSPFTKYAAGLAILAVLAGTNTAAYAHVTVKPSEVATASYQVFTVSVPNEKNIPTTSIKLLIPGSITSATPTQKAGWQITKETETSNDTTSTTSLVWDGGAIAEGTRDEFSFSAKVPDTATKLQWKAYQTYADGTVVAWDQENKEGHSHSSDNGPFSVTQVVDQPTEAHMTAKADQAAAESKVTAERALYVSLGALALGGLSVFLALRKK